jgi:hypothetical protein
MAPRVGKDDSRFFVGRVVEFDRTEAGGAEVLFQIGAGKQPQFQRQAGAAMKNQIMEGLDSAIPPAVRELPRAFLFGQPPVEKLGKMFPRVSN